MIETQLEFCLQKGRDAWKAFNSLSIPRNELDRLIAMPYLNSKAVLYAMPVLR